MRHGSWRIVATFILVTGVVLLNVVDLTAAEKRSKEGPLIDKRVAKLFGGIEGLTAVTGATKVEAFRVTPYGDTKEGREKLGGYPITSAALKVDPKLAAGLARFLTAPGTYGLKYHKACKFAPGVLLRFTKDKSTTDILLCFSCDQLAIYRGKTRTGFEDFRNRKELVGLVKKVFPDDDEIQKLK